MREDASRLVSEALDELSRTGALRRVWGMDASLWTDDPAERAVCATRLGWLHCPSTFVHRVPDIEAFTARVAADGIRHAVLLGMGGSSLAADVLATSLADRAACPQLIVLDSTDPLAIRAVEARIDVRRTVFLVASKSGGTLETDCLRAHFTERLRQAGVAYTGDHLVAITDPGSSLARQAVEERWRAVFENPPDIGGRFSALSFFGLVPAALAGIDPTELLAAAYEEARNTVAWPSTPDAPSPAVQLAALMGGLARAGIDKLTLLTSPSLASFGPWLEQLVAESTGKSGRGIVPVVGEALAPDTPDRCYLTITLEGEACPGAPPGAPQIAWRIGRGDEVAALFFRLEMATALASALLGVEPFDQPNVAEAKAATKAALDTGEPAPSTELARTESFTLSAPPTGAGRLHAADAATVLGAHLCSARTGDYFAVLSYAPWSEGGDAALARLAAVVGEKTGLPVTVGVGPRYLHSTGQLHKGGPDKGVFLLVGGPPAGAQDLPVPGRGVTFDRVFRAQAEGDAAALTARGRRLLRIHLASSSQTALDAVTRVVADLPACPPAA